MGSDVVFDSLYFDRYLRLGWYLDIIILLLLGDASLTFEPDSVVDLDNWDHTFDGGWFGVIWFSDLLYIYAIVGHIFPFDRDLRIFMESHDRPHLWDAR